MLRIVAAACLTLIVCLSVSHPGHADGILGKRHAAIWAGVLRPGELAIREIDSAVLIFGGGLGYPVTSNLDLSLSFGYDILQSEHGRFKVTSFGAFPGAIYHFAPGKECDPFVGAEIGCVFTRVKAGYGDSEDLGWTVAGGAEIRAGDSAALTPYAAFTKVDEEDGFSINVKLDNWFSGRIGGVLNLGYGVDEGDLAASAGILFAF